MKSGPAPDARISTGLPSHPKTKKLIKRLGADGAWALTKLFLWCTTNRTSGDLSGLSDEDIEIAIDWMGENGALVAALVDVRFLDGEPGARCVHDWAEHNPWVNGSGQRSIKGKWNAAKRHYGVQEANRMVPEYAAMRANVDADSSAGSTKNDASSNAENQEKGESSNANVAHVAMLQGEASNAPSPSPSPIPTPLPKAKSKSMSPSAAAAADEPDDDLEFVAFWKSYPRIMGKRPGKQAAFKAWRKLKPGPALQATMASAVASAAKSEKWRESNGAFIPHASTWINGRRWEDEQDVDTSGSNQAPVEPGQRRPDGRIQVAL